jgi:hypothetical protein
MISNTSCNANTVAPPFTGTPASARSDAHASSSEATEFSDQIAYLERRRAAQAEAREPSETPDAIDGDMTNGAFVSHSSDRHLIENDKTITDINGSAIPVLPLPVPPVPPVPMPIPAVDTSPVLVIDTPAVQAPSENEINSDFPDTGPISTNEEPRNESVTRAAIVGNTVEPSISFSGHGSDAQNSEATSRVLTTSVNNTPGKGAIGTIADNAISASRSGSDVTVGPFSGDMQALLSEFEASVNHFERSGNQWIGNAKIVFQSTVLNGASVQITGDGKSLSILLTQSAQSSPIALLSRQEKQLCDALTRRLGRVVTLHVQQKFETQAADDTEPQ